MEQGKKLPDISSLLSGNIGQSDRENEWYKAMQKLYEGKNLHFITDISDRDIVMLIRLSMLQRWTQNDKNIVPEFMKKVMELRVSRTRKGRAEFFDAIKQPNTYITGENQQGGMDSWFRPRR